MWIGSRHALPPLTNGSLPVDAAGPRGEANFSLRETIHQASEGGAVYPLWTIAALAVLVGLGIAVLLMLYGLRGPRPRKPYRLGLPGHDMAFARPIYVYTGLRAEVRRIYLGFLETLRSLGYTLKPGTTVREVEDMVAARGVGRGLSRIYEDAIYSPREPGPRMVEEFRRVARIDT